MASVGGAAPQPLPGTRPFWEGTQAGELRLQLCDSCDTHALYPRPHCPACGAEALSWVRASGRARLYSNVINLMPMPGWTGAMPYVIAVVELEGPRMMTNLVGVPPDPKHLVLDMPTGKLYKQQLRERYGVANPAAAQPRAD